MLGANFDRPPRQAEGFPFEQITAGARAPERTDRTLLVDGPPACYVDGVYTKDRQDTHFIARVTRIAQDPRYII